MTKNIYLDHGATTPVHPDVLSAMLPHWTEQYGNPSSTHSYGQAAQHALDEARQNIAEVMGAEAKEIVFTGCGSESDNLALRGVMWAARRDNRGNHLITSRVEHKAVLNTAMQLRDQFGFEVTILGVDQYGRIDPTALEAAIRPDTALISIMAANNEVGTLQPIQEIGTIARKHDVLFHTDAIQAAICTRWDMRTMPIDLLSLAPHKFYGPKGVGILYVREGIDLVSNLTGGGQEEGRRSGTVNVPFAVGAARAFRLANTDMSARVAHYTRLRDRLIKGIIGLAPEDIILTGHPTERLPHNASFALRQISGNDLLLHLDMAGIAASSGSACKTGDPKPSAVLQAIGLDAEWDRGGLRLTVGAQNNMTEIDYVVTQLPGILEKLRKMLMLFA